MSVFEQDQTSPEAPAVDVQPEGQGVEDGQSVVQPDEGQGQQDSLYDLSSVPEDAREWATAWAKEQDARVNKKFQEHAEYRKQWEPYEQQLAGADPESVGAAMELLTHLSDESTAQDAVLELCRMVGLEIEGDDAEDAEEVDPAEQLRQELREEFAPLSESVAQQREQAAYQARLTELEQEWSEVEAEHGKAFTPEEQEKLIGLAERFGGDTPLKTAYTVFNDISGFAEKQLVTAKTREPRPAVKAGRAATAPPAIDSFDDAERIHRERRSSSL